MAKSARQDSVALANDRVLRISEVAEYVGKTRQTVSQWIKDGLLGVVKHPSGLPGVMWSELERFYGASNLAKRKE